MRTWKRNFFNAKDKEIRKNIFILLQRNVRRHRRRHLGGKEELHKLLNILLDEKFVRIRQLILDFRILIHFYVLVEEKNGL
jgi:hypothetical protein